MTMNLVSNFDVAVLTVLKQEGFYVNDGFDSGGPTNFGVSLHLLQKQKEINRYGQLNYDFDCDGDIDADDIAFLKKHDAIKIYREVWWDKYGYDSIPDKDLATKLLSLAVNMGQKQAVTCLQRALTCLGHRIKEDGVMGIKTLSAVRDSNKDMLMVSFKSEAAGFYRSLNKGMYIAGWLKRAYA